MKSKNLAARLFIALTVIIFAVELAIMVLLGSVLSNLSILSVSLLDSVMLAGLLFPVLYILVFRPLSESLKERESAQESLEEALASVETQVRERTAELELTNKQLETQAKERERAKDLSDTLNEINAEISTMVDFDQIAEMVVTKATKKLDCKASAVIMRGEGHWVFSHVFGLPETYVGTQIADKDAPCATETIKSKQVFVGDADDMENRINQGPLAKEGFRSFITVPLIIKGEVIGVIDFYHHTAHSALSETEIDFARKLSAATSMALESARLYGTQRDIADTLQEALLKMPEKMDGVEFSYLYRSATTEPGRAGGDFYDLFELEHSKIGLMIGDVSGKGLEAATLTSLVKNTIRAYAYQHSTPAEIIEMTSSVLLRTPRVSSFVTLFFGILDKSSGDLTYCAAGHPPAILQRPSGETSFLKVGSPVVGAFSEFKFVDLHATVEKGDILVLYTDGVTEAKSDQGFLGEERFRELVADMQGATVGEIPQEIVRVLIDQKEYALFDDVALLALSLVE